MQLSELTKKELIALVKQKAILFEESDIASVRWHSLIAQASDLRKQSIAVGRQIKGFDLESHSKSVKLWNKSETVQRKADALYKKYWGGT